MPMTMEELEIRSVIERYTDALNTQNWAALAPLFASQAVWETSGGPIELRFEGRDAVLGALQGMLTSLDFLVQSLGSVVIELNGDQARARVSLQELGRDKDGRGMLNVGVYFDDLAKIEGRWQFVKRSFRFRYADAPALAGAVFALPVSHP